MRKDFVWKLSLAIVAGALVAGAGFAIAGGSKLTDSRLPNNRTPVISQPQQPPVTRLNPGRLEPGKGISKADEGCCETVGELCFDAPHDRCVKPNSWYGTSFHCQEDKCQRAMPPLGDD